MTASGAKGSLPAVVTAGGRIDGEFAAVAGTAVKALAPIGGGARLIDPILNALGNLPTIGQIVVVGPVDDLNSVERGPRGRLLAEGASGPENVQRGIAAVQENGELPERLLLCTSDLPFVTADTLASFIAAAPPDADIVYPVVERGAYESAYPGSPNTFARLGGSEYTGGGVFLVNPQAIVSNAALIAAVFDARKSQMAMARMLGLPSVLRFLTGRLTVAQAEARVSELTGCRCRALVGSPVSLCSDIDSLADYQYVLKRGSSMAAGGNVTPEIAVYQNRA